MEKGICYSYCTSDKIGVTIISDEEYPRRVAVDLMYKINAEFNQYIYTQKINLNQINKDENYKFKYIEDILAEWQDPKSSNILIYF